MEAAVAHLRELFPKVDLRLLKAAIREHGTSPEAIDEAIQYLMDEAVSESSSDGDVSDKEDDVEDSKILGGSLETEASGPSGSPSNAGLHESPLVDNESLNEAANNEESFFEAEQDLPTLSTPLQSSTPLTDGVTSSTVAELPVAELPPAELSPVSASPPSVSSVEDASMTNNGRVEDGVVRAASPRDSDSDAQVVADAEANNGDLTSRDVGSSAPGCDAVPSEAVASSSTAIAGSSTDEDVRVIAGSSANPSTEPSDFPTAHVSKADVREEIVGEAADVSEAALTSAEETYSGFVDMCIVKSHVPDVDDGSTGDESKADAEPVAEAADVPEATLASAEVADSDFVDTCTVESDVESTSDMSDADSAHAAPPADVDVGDELEADVMVEAGCDVTDAPEEGSEDEAVVAQGKEGEQLVDAGADANDVAAVAADQTLEAVQGAAEDAQDLKAGEEQEEEQTEGQVVEKEEVMEVEEEQQQEVGGEKQKGDEEGGEEEDAEEDEEEDEELQVDVPESLVNSWSRSFMQVDVEAISSHVSSTATAKSRLQSELENVRSLLLQVEQAEQEVAAAESALSHAGERDNAEADDVLRHVARSHQALEIRAAQVFGHREQLNEEAAGLKARVAGLKSMFAEVEVELGEVRTALEGRLERARERLGEVERQREEREEEGRRRREAAEGEMGKVLAEVPRLEGQERACAELADALVARHHEADVLEGQLAVLREDLAALVRGVGRLPKGGEEDDLGYSFLTEASGERDIEGSQLESFQSLHEDFTHDSPAADANLPGMQSVGSAPERDDVAAVAAVLPAEESAADGAAASEADDAAALYTELSSAQNLTSAAESSASASAANADAPSAADSPIVAAAGASAADAAAASASDTVAAPALPGTSSSSSVSPLDDEDQFEAKMREMSGMLRESLPLSRSRFPHGQPNPQWLQDQQQLQEQEQRERQESMERALAESATGVEGVTMVEDGDWSVLEASDMLGSGVGGFGAVEGFDARSSGHSSFSVHAGSTPRARDNAGRLDGYGIGEVMERYFGSSE